MDSGQSDEILVKSIRQRALKWKIPGFQEIDESVLKRSISFGVRQEGGLSIIHEDVIDAYLRLTEWQRHQLDTFRVVLEYQEVSSLDPYKLLNQLRTDWEVYACMIWELFHFQPKTIRVFQDNLPSYGPPKVFEDLRKIFTYYVLDDPTEEIDLQQIIEGLSKSLRDASAPDGFSNSLDDTNSFDSDSDILVSHLMQSDHPPE